MGFVAAAAALLGGMCSQASAQRLNLGEVAPPRVGESSVLTEMRAEAEEEAAAWASRAATGERTGADPDRMLVMRARAAFRAMAVALIDAAGGAEGANTDDGANAVLHALTLFQGRAALDDLTDRFLELSRSGAEELRRRGAGAGEVGDQGAAVIARWQEARESLSAFVRAAERATAEGGTSLPRATDELDTALRDVFAELIGVVGAVDGVTARARWGMERSEVEEAGDVLDAAEIGNDPAIAEVVEMLRAAMRRPELRPRAVPVLMSLRVMQSWMAAPGVNLRAPEALRAHTMEFRDWFLASLGEEDRARRDAALRAALRTCLVLANAQSYYAAFDAKEPAAAVIDPIVSGMVAKCLAGRGGEAETNAAREVWRIVGIVRWSAPNRPPEEMAPAAQKAWRLLVQEREACSRRALEALPRLAEDAHLAHTPEMVSLFAAVERIESSIAALEAVERWRGELSMRGEPGYTAAAERLGALAREAGEKETREAALAKLEEFAEGYRRLAWLRGERLLKLAARLVVTQNEEAARMDAVGSPEEASAAAERVRSLLGDRARQLVMELNEDRNAWMGNWAGDAAQPKYLLDALRSREELCAALVCWEVLCDDALVRGMNASARIELPVAGPRGEAGDGGGGFPRAIEHLRMKLGERISAQADRLQGGSGPAGEVPAGFVALRRPIEVLLAGPLLQHRSMHQLKGAGWLSGLTGTGVETTKGQGAWVVGQLAIPPSMIDFAIEGVENPRAEMARISRWMFELEKALEEGDEALAEDILQYLDDRAERVGDRSQSTGAWEFNR